MGGLIRGSPYSVFSSGLPVVLSLNCIRRKLEREGDSRRNRDDDVDE